MNKNKFLIWDGRDFHADDNICFYKDRPYVVDSSTNSISPLISDSEENIYGSPVLIKFIGVQDSFHADIFEYDVVYIKPDDLGTGIYALIIFDIKTAGYIMISLFSKIKYTIGSHRIMIVGNGYKPPCGLSDTELKNLKELIKEYSE